MRLVASVFLVSGAGLIWLWRLARSENLPRNRFAGIRTRRTMSSDAAWLTAHRAAAWSFGVAGLAFIVSSAILVVADPAESAVTAIALVTGLVVTGVVVAGGAQANRVAGEV